LDSFLEGREDGLENVRGRRRRTSKEKRKNTVKPSPNLDSKGMGHETPFLLFTRPITENKDPKKIDLRPKLPVKETKIN